MIKLRLLRSGDFPGGPVVETSHFHCRGHGMGSIPGPGTDSTCHTEWPKKKKEAGEIKSYPGFPGWAHCKHHGRDKC